MGLFTSVKETVLGTDDGADGAKGVGDVAEERPDERRGPLAAVGFASRSAGEAESAGRAKSEGGGESASVVETAEEYASEADFVVATGRSREDALVELVEASGGRVRQSELVERTGWSKATVSRYLGALEDDGAIYRVAVGRQKVVLLPDESLLNESLGPDDAGGGPDGGPTSDAGYPRP